MTGRRRSAGLLLYRRRDDAIEVLLAHPGGPLWAKRDDGAWTIPKGELQPGEDGLVCAQREFREELGDAPRASGAPVELTPVRQAGGKRVLAWALEGDFDADAIHSNVFTMQWPPRSGRHQEFPEVDRAQWFPLALARSKLLAGQVPLLEQLAALTAPRS